MFAFCSPSFPSLASSEDGISPWTLADDSGTTVGKSPATRRTLSGLHAFRDKPPMAQSVLILFFGMPAATCMALVCAPRWLLGSFVIEDCDDHAHTCSCEMCSHHPEFPRTRKRDTPRMETMGGSATCGKGASRFESRRF